MKIAIDQIQLDEATRIRKDVGNLSTLEESIGSVGLINPILVDENFKLLAGFRRLAACKNLGWKEVEIRIVDLNGDQLKMLDVEIAENFFRKDFTPEEVLSTETRRAEILEELREKGIFERFWLWLKGLFTRKPTEQEPAVVLPQTDKPAAQPIPDASTVTAGSAEPVVEDPASPESTEAAETAAPPESPAENPESPDSQEKVKTVSPEGGGPQNGK